MRTKIILKFVAFMLCLVVVSLCCTSCSYSPKDFVGKWTVKEISFSDSGLVENDLQLQALELAYEDLSLQLYEDYSGKLHYLNRYYEITWELNEGKHFDKINVYLDSLLFQEYDINDENSLWISVETDIVMVGLMLSKY